MSEHKPDGPTQHWELLTSIIVAALVSLIVWVNYEQVHGAERSSAASSFQLSLFSECMAEARANIQRCKGDAQRANFEQTAEYFDLKAQQEMARWASLMFIVTSVGVAYVALTFRQAAEANQAAQDAVSTTSKIGYGQLRPYVGLRDINCVVSLGGFQLQPVWKNFGNTPATNIRCMLGWDKLATEPDGNFGYPDRLKEPTRFQLPPGHHIPLFGPSITNSELDEFVRVKTKLYIWGWIEYGDNMNPLARHRTEFCQAFVVYGPRDNWKLMGAGPFNGSDAECLRQPRVEC